MILAAGFEPASPDRESRILGQLDDARDGAHAGNRTHDYRVESPVDWPLSDMSVNGSGTWSRTTSFLVQSQAFYRLKYP